MSRLIGKGLLVLFTTLLFAGRVSAQTKIGGSLYINGSFINSGTITVNNHIINNTSGPVSVLPGTTASTVVLQGAANANGHYIYGGGSINFYRLDLKGGRETRLKVNVEVTNRLQAGYTGNTFTAADSGFTIENDTLTIDSLATYLGTANLTFAGGTVIYKGAQSQATINKTTGVKYGILNFSGAGAKSISATTSGLDTAATLTQTGGQLSITESIDVTSKGSFNDLGAISAGKKLRLTGSATRCLVTSLNNTGTGTFENASNAADTITTLIANAGTINQSGTTGKITFTQSAASNGTITNSSTGGTITFVKNLTGTGTISQTSSGIINVGGSFVQNTYTLTGTNGTVVYDSGAAQSIISTAYYNLTISNATDTTIANYKTAAGAITLTGNLVVNSGNTLDMQGYAITTPGAGSSNSGKIKWSANNSYVGGTGVTEFYGSTAGNIATGSNYGTLLFTGTGMKTFGTNPVTAVGTMTLFLNSQITINNGVTLQVNGGLTTYGSVTNNGAFNIGN